ncbi:hypothetical protein [uncultured Pontibacter sp.]|uniref:hypothetical protein n=1 Tax=uncultured Pontibacter sp. TaxID=453356 RepID=UPI0026181AD9|nr:hypothetical protein [uncultured Pontibacter sp.]
MEGMDWYNRTGYTDYRNHYRGDERPMDEDEYRGAYRLDTSSKHSNQSTWDWNRDQGRDHSRNNYNRDYNRNYNRDYNQDYNSGNQRAGHLANQRDYERDWSGNYHKDRGGYDHDNQNMDSRYRRNDSDRSYKTSNSSDWNRNRNDDYNSHDRGQGSHRSVRSRIDEGNRDRSGSSNFNADYGPDRYGRGGGENYGNMAGSLSYGYDGANNHDPDWDRHYDPLSGRRQRKGGNYTSRHTGQSQNRDSDRNSNNRY